VLVVGSANVDVVLHLDSLPEPGETALARGSERGFGGKGANQALAAAAAGARVALLGRVGADPAGEAYRERLSAAGVEITHLVPVPGVPTGTAYVMVDGDGENSIVVEPGANSRLTARDLAPVSDLGPGDVLLVQCEIPHDVVVAAIRAGHAAGARVVLNLAPYAPLPDDVFPLADPVVVNEQEAILFQEGIFAENSLGLKADVAGSLLITRGEAGATWGDLDLPAEPVDQVVDTTGAGDAFCGALAAALAGGADDEQALRVALAAGADAVRRPGAQPR
jgi:ribokinase